MKPSSRNRSAFTMVEILVTMAIAVSLAAAAYITLTSRSTHAEVEAAAIKLAEIFEFARNDALTTRCPTRVIFCMDASCATPTDEASSGIIGPAADNPARYVAVLRKAFYDQSKQQDSCFVRETTGGDGTWTAPTDGFANWDFVMKPQWLSRSVVLADMYSGSVGGVGVDDWERNNAATASDSLWFPGSLVRERGYQPNLASVPAFGPIDAGSDDHVNASGDMVIFAQVQNSQCSGADCVAFFVGLDENGSAKVQQCEPGASRPGSLNGCH